MLLFGILIIRQALILFFILLMPVASLLLIIPGGYGFINELYTSITRAEIVIIPRITSTVKIEILVDKNIGGKKRSRKKERRVT